MVLTRLRGYIGFLPVRRTLPNSTHHALATLQHAGVVGTLITQNVDGLHHAALRHILPEPEVDRRILELHGSIFVSPRCFCFPSPSPFESSASHTITAPFLKISGFLLFSENSGGIQKKFDRNTNPQKVHCRYGHVYPRTVFQEWLGQANPRWRTFITELERTGAQPKTNPDGDVALTPPFSYPDCALTIYTYTFLLT